MGRNTIGVYLLLAAAVIIPSSCDFSEESGERVIIKVGQRHITENELKRDIRRFTIEMGISDQGLDEVVEPLVNRVIDNYLILEYGRDKGISITQEEFESALQGIKKDYPDDVFRETLLQGYIDFEEWKLRLREQLLITKILKKVSEGIKPVPFQEMKAYFDSHRGEFKRPQMINFRQIVTRTKGEAQKIRALLDQGKDMGALARDYSIAPEAANMGEVGWVAKGNLDETMEDMIFSLPPGKRSPILKTRYGFHIFEVISKRQEGLKSFSEAMAEIESKLFYEKENAYLTRWLGGLKGVFPVEVNQELLKKMELG
ncbi:MAG: peptidylprolyl isomerase [Pseudomonadota bacterium]